MVRAGEPSEYFLAADSGPDLFLRCGLRVNDQGEIDDVFAGSPADVAGLVPGSRVLAVNRHRFTQQRLLRASGTTELIVEQEELFSIRLLDIPEGDDFPVLERIEDRPDLLAEIFAPRRAEVGKESARAGRGSR